MAGAEPDPGVGGGVWLRHAVHQLPHRRRLVPPVQVRPRSPLPCDNPLEPLFQDLKLSLSWQKFQISADDDLNR